MVNEKYNLTWHTYSDHLKQMLQSLMNDKDSQDVTLVCDDRVKIKAHRIVLKACSPVFETIFDSDSSNNTIYLRGIQHQEMQSLIQFMYLGEATFYQDRMNEFLRVAKDLEVKELNKDVDEVDVEASEQINDQSERHEGLLQEDDVIPTRPLPSVAVVDQNKPSLPVVTDDPASKQCPDCGKEFSIRHAMLRHHRSAHQGVRYPCSQCDFKAAFSSDLKKHVESAHEGVKYPCNHCQYQATQRINLNRHIKNKH